MLTQAAGPAIRAAVVNYFIGERSEMVIAIAAFVSGAGATALALHSSRSGFAMALLVTVMLFGGLMGAGAASLMISRCHIVPGP